MATKEEKKEDLRRKILVSSHHYRDRLAGKVFLYVTGEEYFEVVFQTDRFMHLTGVNSSLNAQDFYTKAKDCILTTEQFFFDDKHPYSAARKKLSCLSRLSDLTDHLVCAVKEMRTLTLTYRLGLTNLDFTIGLTENRDRGGNKVNDWFLPRTLRVKDSAIENSANAEFVDFIFSKNATSEKYTAATFVGEGKRVPTSVISMLSEELKRGLCI